MNTVTAKSDNVTTFIAEEKEAKELFEGIKAAIGGIEGLMPFALDTYKIHQKAWITSKDVTVHIIQDLYEDTIIGATRHYLEEVLGSWVSTTLSCYAKTMNQRFGKVEKRSIRNSKHSPNKGKGSGCSVEYKVSAKPCNKRHDRYIVERAQAQDATAQAQAIVSDLWKQVKANMDIWRVLASNDSKYFTTKEISEAIMAKYSQLNDLSDLVRVAVRVSLSSHIKECLVTMMSGTYSRVRANVYKPIVERRDIQGNKKGRGIRVQHEYRALLIPELKGTILEIQENMESADRNLKLDLNIDDEQVGAKWVPKRENVEGKVKPPKMKVTVPVLVSPATRSAQAHKQETKPDPLKPEPSTSATGFEIVKDLVSKMSAEQCTILSIELASRQSKIVREAEAELQKALTQIDDLKKSMAEVERIKKFIQEMG